MIRNGDGVRWRNRVLALALAVLAVGASSDATFAQEVRKLAAPEAVQVPKISPELRRLAASPGRYRAVIVLKEQPQKEFLELHREWRRVRAENATNRYLAENSRLLLNDAALQAAAVELDAVELDIRRAAYLDVGIRIKPGQDQVEALVTSAGGVVVHRLTALNALIVDIPLSSLDLLEREPQIEEVREDRVIPPLLPKSVPYINTSTFWTASPNPIRGVGFTVAVLDTGLLNSHVNFSTKTIINKNYCPAGDGSDTTDPVGHGTHVNGIVGGVGNGVDGVARGVSTMVNLRIGCGALGSSNHTDVLAAMNWALTNTAAKVFNYSFGYMDSGDDSGDARDFDRLMDNSRIIMSIAAGNANSSTDSSCHVNGVAQQGAESRAYNGISVANYDILLNTTWQSCAGPTSSGRRKPDLAAPGANFSDLGGGILAPDSSDPNGYVRKSGTSMAAPHVAGALILLQQYFGAGWDPAFAKAILVNSPAPSSFPTYSNYWGWGIIDLATAYNQLKNGVTGSVSAGGSSFYQGTMTGRMQVTLVWNRNFGNGSPNLNDLDLSVYRADTGALLATSNSSIDNVEKVDVSFAGAVIIKVKAITSPLKGLDSQPFAMAISQSGFSAQGRILLNPQCTAPNSGNVAPGASFTLSCQVTNITNIMAGTPNATLTLTVPAGFAVAGGNVWNIGALPANTSQSRNFTITASATPGEYNIAANASYPVVGEPAVGIIQNTPIHVAGQRVVVFANPGGGLLQSTAYPVIVDGTTYTGPKTFTWTVGSAHTLAVPQTAISLGEGTRLRFSDWINAGAGSAVTVTGQAGFVDYWARFSLEQRLARSATAGGSVTVSSNNTEQSGGYFSNDATVTLTAVPLSAKTTFVNWTGDVGLTGPGGEAVTTSTSLALSVKMDKPRTLRANFVGTATTSVVANLNDSGAGSLRQAVAETAPGGLVDLRGLSGTITLTSGEINIPGNMTLVGPGAAVLTISGNNASRIFRVTGGAVRISGMKLTAGLARGGDGGTAFFEGGGGAGMGGAIFVNAGKVWLQSMTFDGNVAKGGNDPGYVDNGVSGQGGGGGSGLEGVASDGAVGAASSGGDGGSGRVDSIFPTAGGKGGTATATAGGSGGLGAGGGGGFLDGPGGNGGFGGGGGGGNATSGGLGGFGGGGGAANYVTIGGRYGGNGQYDGAGGGGGLGGAVFVREGATLNVMNVQFNNNEVTAGTGWNAGEAKGGALFAYGTASYRQFGNVSYGTNVAGDAGAKTNCGGSPALDNANICGVIDIRVPGLAITGGQGQSVNTDTTFPQALVVKVTDDAGAAIPFAEVTFTVTNAANGAGAKFGTATTATVAADAAGVASINTLKANATPGGPYKVTATTGTASAIFNLTNNAVNVTVTVTSTPVGRTVVVDGTSYTTPKDLTWLSGTAHTISAATQNGATGQRFAFANWSDSGAASHTVTGPAAATTYTAAFTTQYLLAAAASPAGAATFALTPVSADGSDFYAAGTSVAVKVNPTSGNVFSSWSGDLSGTVNPSSVTMSAARTVVAAIVSSEPRAQMATPVAGTVFTGSSVTFTWSAGVGAVAYWLDIGNAVGQGNFSTGELTVTTKTVSVPCDGKTIFARLWTRSSSGYLTPIDYTYTAAASCAGGLTVSAITAPAPGTLLTGSSVNFVWTAATGALDYWLDIGTSKGSGNLSGGVVASTAKTVTGLPCTGITIFARLWTRTASGYQTPVDYTYTAASGCTVDPRATMLTPTSGSTFSASSVTFTWTAGTGAIDYWLDIGNSAGAGNIASGVVAATSRTVTGIPCTGVPIFARLWTRTASGYLTPLDYVYTAAASCAAEVRGTLLSPAAGSTLSGASVTFTWAAGAAALDYWLDVGTAVGSGNTASGVVSGTAKTVTGLPCTGVPMFARLWTRTAAGYLTPIDYSFTAAASCAAEVRGTLTSPAPGSTLSGASVTFTWAAGAGALDYWLDVGNAVGAGSIANGVVTGTSKAVSGIPCTGLPIFARLWTRTAAGYQSPIDYTYTAASGCAASPLAAILTPSPGSTISGGSANFTWTAGTGASEYWLDVGTAAGVGNLSAGSTGLVTAKPVSGLPVSGGVTIYARLWTKIAGVWAYRDYTFVTP